MGQCIALPVVPPRPKPKHRSRGLPEKDELTRAKTFTEKYGTHEVRSRFHEAYELGKIGKLSSFGSRATSNGTSAIGAGVDEHFKTEVSSPLKSEISSGTGFCPPVPRLTLRHSNSCVTRCTSMDNCNNYSPDSASTGGGTSTRGRIPSGVIPRSKMLHMHPIKPQLPFEEERCDVSVSESESVDLELVRSMRPQEDSAPTPARPEEEIHKIMGVEMKPACSSEAPLGCDEEMEDCRLDEVEEEDEEGNIHTVGKFIDEFTKQMKMLLLKKHEQMDRICARNQALRQVEFIPRHDQTPSPSPSPPSSNIPQRPYYPGSRSVPSVCGALTHYDPSRSISLPLPRLDHKLQSDAQSRRSNSTRDYRDKSPPEDPERKKVQGETLQLERMQLQLDFGTLTPITEQQTGTSGSGSRDSASFFDMSHIPADDIWKVENGELGRGASGCVWLCRWRGAEVAVKEWFGLSNERNRDEMRQEADMLSGLRHPCVISIYGHTTMEGSPATVAEFVLHGAMSSALRKMREKGGLTTQQKVALALQTAYGMDFLHSKSIIHFDLKAANLLCDLRDLDRPLVKIADVGLSKKKLDTFVSGNMRGTLPWMAPELFPSLDCMANNPGGVTDKVNEKVDVYSYAIVLWEIWTLGEEPYQGLSMTDVLYGLMGGNLRPEIPSNCEPFWARLMMQCWSQDAVDRPSFDQITKDLDQSYRNMDFEMV